MKTQELQLGRLKDKLDAINNSEKSPASLTAMQTELKKVDKEFKDTEQKWMSLLDSMDGKQIDIDWAKSSGDVEGFNRATRELVNLENESLVLENNLSNLKDKSSQLASKIEQVKLNPSNTGEAVRLKQQIGLVTSKLEQSKEKANELKDSIDNAMNRKSGSSEKIIRSIGKQMNNIGQNVGSNMNKKFDGLGKKVDTVSKSIARFRKRIMALIGSAIVFNVLSNGLRKLQQNLGSLLMSNNMFSNSLNQIKVNLLTAFAPIYQAILPAINSLMNALANITGAIATFVSGLFGKTASESKKSAESLYNQSKAYDELGKSANKAKEAEEGRLASFDKLEVIDTPKNDDTGSNNGPTVDFSPSVSSGGQFLDLLNKIKEFITSGDWYGLGSYIANGINKGLNKLNIDDFFKKVKQGAKNIAQLVNGFIATLDWKLLGTKVSDTIKGLLETITTFIQEINWEELGRAIGDFLLGIDWLGILIDIVTLITEGLSALKDILIGFVFSMIDNIKNIDWGQLGSQIVELLAKGLKLLIQTVGGIFLKIVENIFNIDWDKIGSDIFNFITDGISGIGKWFSETFNNAKNGATKAFSDIGKWAQEKYNDITSVFSKIPEWFKNIFTSAWEGVRNVFSTGGKIFDGIKDGISNVFRNVVNALIDGINRIIKIPFNSINGMLNKIKAISILGAKPFDRAWGYNPIGVPQIPKLATGAVIPPNSEFLAVLGDQKHGTNIETPLRTMKQAFNEELNKRDAMNSRPIYLRGDITAYFGDESVGRVAYKGIRLVEEQTGQALFVN